MTITLALLGAIASLLFTRVADGMIDNRHKPNQELMDQGFSNFVTPFFGGVPATGVIARSGFVNRVGLAHIHQNLADAMAAALAHATASAPGDNRVRGS